MKINKKAISINNKSINEMKIFNNVINKWIIMASMAMILCLSAEENEINNRHQMKNK